MGSTEQPKQGHMSSVILRVSRYQVEDLDNPKPTKDRHGGRRGGFTTRPGLRPFYTTTRGTTLIFAPATIGQSAHGPLMQRTHLGATTAASRQHGLSRDAPNCAVPRLAQRRASVGASLSPRLPGRKSIYHSGLASICIFGVILADWRPFGLTGSPMLG